MGKLIDAEKFLESLACIEPTEQWIHWDDIVDAVKDLPSAEPQYHNTDGLHKHYEHYHGMENLLAEPLIIHCKDCKHYEHDVGNEEYGVCCNSQWVLGNVGCGVSAIDFCSYAERRSNETD